LNYKNATAVNHSAADNKKPINILNWKTYADVGTDMTSFATDLEKKCELRKSFQ